MNALLSNLLDYSALSDAYLNIFPLFVSYLHYFNDIMISSRVSLHLLQKLLGRDAKIILLLPIIRVHTFTSSTSRYQGGEESAPTWNWIPPRKAQSVVRKDDDVIPVIER
jgi:hypothetical protein